MKKFLLSFIILCVIVLASLQFVPVKRDNPPVTADIVLPPAVREILKRSCYDCHSNETHWPWYAYVAPVSWYVTDDVAEGRRKLNFSEWDQYSEKKQEHRLRKVWKEIDKGDMPIEEYLYIHWDAELSEQDKQTIKAWLIESKIPLTKHPKKDNNDQSNTTTKTDNEIHSATPAPSTDNNGQ